MNRSLLKVITTLFYLAMLPLSLFLLYLGWTEGAWPLAGFGFILLASHLGMLIRKKNEPLRYLYPGIATFLLLMVVPIAFTIAIAFTNLGTAHYFNQDQARAILLSQKSLDEQQGVLDFAIYETSQGKLRCEVSYGEKYYEALWSPDQSAAVIDLASVANLSHEGHKLTYSQVYEHHAALVKLNFRLSDRPETIYSYYRIDKLASFLPRFVELEDHSLHESKTGAIYKPDSENGFYHSGGNKLFPGYYINVGWSNFTKLLSRDLFQAYFVKVVGWTFVWAFLSVFLSFALGLSLALIINSRLVKGKSLYRLLFIIPYAIPFFISVLIFKGMMNKDFGLFNQLLQDYLHVKVDWLSDPILAKVSCLLVNLWLGFPYMFLVTTGVLQAIPPTVYEAAKLDGANPWRVAISISLPMILSAMVPLLIGSFAFNLNNFVGIYLLTGGGPPIPSAVLPVGETDILISFTYRLAFEGAKGQDFGLASAISLLIFGIVAALTLLNFKLVGFKEGETA